VRYLRFRSVTVQLVILFVAALAILEIVSLGYRYISRTEALASLEQGSRIDPSRPEVRVQLARAYRLKGMLVRAEQQLKLARPASGATMGASLFQHQRVEFDFYVEQGLLRLQQKQFQAAADAFRKVLDMDPNHGPAHRHLAEVYLSQGSYKRAAEHAARAATLGAPLPEATERLLQQKLRGQDAGPGK